MSRLVGLTAALIDDAAVFPPGNLPLPDAVSAAYARVDQPVESLVGPLLVPASAVPQLREVVDPNRVLVIGLVGDTGLTGLEAARDSLQNDPWVEIAHVELAVPQGADSTAAVRALLDDLSFTVPTYVELPLDPDPRLALAALAADGAERAKFRTGPVVIPTGQHLARAISGAVEAGVPFKLTGGLHHALPVDEEDQRHHGFLNTLAATALALAGADRQQLADVLASDDLPTVLAALEVSDIGRVRRQYRSFGSCSISEPYRDLLDLELVEAM